MAGKIKLISGWSNYGGSTYHHIRLTNLLNSNGYDCTFYGPHDWHLDKCKSQKITELPKIEKSDIIISHFVPPSLFKSQCSKHILSCHETNLFNIEPTAYSHIQFVSKEQMKWHNNLTPLNKNKCFIIPPIVDKIDWGSPNNKVAGVIGSIDSHKQTHLAIELALSMGYEKVLLYGGINHYQYYVNFILPYVQAKKVVIAGHEDDKVKMYNCVSAVFHMSKRETYGLVEAECKLAGIPFIGKSNNQPILDQQEILERWKTILES